uniref:Uncharacterized protein n=1 Tax=Spongospora subterranea TaxID=70186 RepID=A0A0H5R7L5_9EUKA|eukprot:CRZ10155.1 hypothetical protein [Spongospora subterranea]
MKALLWEFDQELLARVDVEMAQLHELVVPIDAIPSTLVNTGPTAKHGEQAVVAPRPPSAPSSPKIRRRSRSNSPQNSPRPIPNAPSAIRCENGLGDQCGFPSEICSTWQIDCWQNKRSAPLSNY